MGRRIAVVVLVALALIVGMIGNLSGWTWWFLADTDNFVDTVAPLSENDEVSAAIATDLVDQVFTTYDVEARLKDALPKRAQFVAGPLVAQAEQFATKYAQQAIQSDAFNTIWRKSLALTQKEAIGILRGEDKVVSATNGQVTIDLTQILEEIDQRLQARGIDVLDNKNLPPNLGKIQLIQDGQLATAQSAVTFLDKVQFWFPLLALLLLGVALAIARNRRKALFGIGIAITAAFLLEMMLLRLARNYIIDQAKPQNQDAVGAIWSQLFHQLYLGLWALVVFGVVIAVSAFLLAPSGSGARSREFVNRRIHGWREGALSEGTQDTLQRALAPWKRAIQFGIVVLILLILVALPSVRPRAVILAALLLVILLAVVEFAAGRSVPKSARLEQPVSEEIPVDTSSD